MEEKSIDKIKDDFILENKYLENIGYCIGNFDQPTGGHFIPEPNDDEEEIIFIKSDNKDSNNEDIKTKLREKILQKSNEKNQTSIKKCPCNKLFNLYNHKF